MFRLKQAQNLESHPHPHDPTRKGSIFVEYLLLVTIVGIGVIVGISCVRMALNNELFDLANAINAINC
ncbi:MAG: hypothetical protein KDA80_09990 [Planctomycetaceae bacterium]|nr:hypothetical protein [Planctomycetaceae bacterium]